MDLTRIEIVLLAVVLALLVTTLVQSQRLSNLKERVNRIERSGAPGVPLGATTGATFGALQRPISMTPELDLEVRRLVASGKKIVAIKLVREQTGLGLKDAKDVVDAY